MNAFSQALDFVLEREGGYANLANDEETNLGVRRSVYEAYLGHPVSDKAFKDLTREQVVALYFDNYWKRAKCDLFSEKLALAVFDFAVNSGVGTAIKQLQSVLRVKQDGTIGEKTLDALHRFGDNLIPEYLLAREAYLKTLKNFPLYGKGWLNRVKLLQEEVSK